MSGSNRSKNVRLVENTVERTARMLAREYNIRVVWKGQEAHTNGNTITLPVLPDDASAELLEAIQGYLDHETAHIIFTDFNAVKKHTPELTPEQFQCVNVVEDVRIERCMENLFPGSPYNLRLCHEWIQSKIAPHWDNINQFKKACTAYFFFTKFGNTDWYQSVVDQTTKDLVEQCISAVGPYDKILSTQHSIDAGLRLYEVLKEEAKQEQKEREEREAAAKKAAGSSGKGKDKNSSEGVGSSGKGKDKNSSEGLQTDKDGNPIITSISDLSKAIAHTAKAELHAKNVSGRSYTHKQEKAGYLVYSTAGDTVASMPDGDLASNGRNLLRLREDARELTSVIKTRLVNSLRASTKRRWLGGKEEGRIDARRLHHALLGTTDNVYKQQTEKLSLNTVVGLAIDHSGSMAGHKLKLAGQTAVVIGDALNTLKIPFMVYGYSTQSAIETPSDTSLYARWGRLWIRYYRDFHESWEKGALRLAGSEQNCQNNTLDAESVKHGVRRLLLRPEKRKILLVLNDGMPYPGYGDVGRCQQHLHDVVASASAAGVEIIAFGIEDSDVKNYYPKHVVIQNLKDLVTQPLQVLDKLLREGVR